ENTATSSSRIPARIASAGSNHGCLGSCGSGIGFLENGEEEPRKKHEDTRKEGRDNAETRSRELSGRRTGSGAGPAFFCVISCSSWFHSSSPAGWLPHRIRGAQAARPFSR